MSIRDNVLAGYKLNNSRVRSQTTMPLSNRHSRVLTCGKRSKTVSTSPVEACSGGGTAGNACALREQSQFALACF